MKYIGIFGALVFILTLGNLQSVTIVSHHPDEEYFLEHEVLYEEAIAEAKKMEIYPAPIPGCKPCTDSEMIYCKDGSVISDHCCCDGSFNSSDGVDILADSHKRINTSVKENTLRIPRMLFIRILFTTINRQTLKINPFD
ncbi:uncharacterized protein LOC114880409 isoform X2 [Osmia bicornis bicornis]|uniref:uncharacterized protein LOC114880409 isoform X2 n=1 Tax=Osmia bicornis bicornis TaxID=1437191 RepID=UPI0010FA5C09|nr:uncharacterized protein LOC114880409 isoform X2 [Osmia bicornis bicornis]